MSTNNEEHSQEKKEVIGKLYPSGLQEPGYEIVSASYNDGGGGILMADTAQGERIVCSVHSPWIFFSSPGKQDRVSFK